MLFITVASVFVALIMSAVAWRTVRNERERSAARIDALAREIHDGPRSVAAAAPARPAAAARTPAPTRTVAPAHAADELLLRPSAPPVEPAGVGDLFAVATKPAGNASRWGLALAIGAFAVACAAALAIVFGGEAPGTRVAQASASSEAGTPPEARPELPLELTALSHERDDGQLTVRGLVRNPAAGTEMNRLSAVVVLFDRDGHVVTTGRAPVASPSLIPGGESPFAVTIPDAANIVRYRVSFRSDERVVAHVDKRVGP